ncbi:hypothetical protein [Oceanobacillus sp. FSL K6-3682]|uniref:hypothetical protein n=1 Tax=Oceanobacillus sp. FSL K6-3682 TaxID=2921503 RepID=UPI0030DB6352
MNEKKTSSTSSFSQELETKLRRIYKSTGYCQSFTRCTDTAYHYAQACFPIG